MDSALDTPRAAATLPAMAEATPEDTARAQKGRVFARRLISSVVLWTLVLASIFSDQPLLSNGVFLLIMLTLAVFGLAEFYGLVEQRGLPCFKTWGISYRPTQRSLVNNGQALMTVAEGNPGTVHYRIVEDGLRQAGNSEEDERE